MRTSPWTPDAKSIGLIINPIAGMGGRVGMKGTDGPEILERSIALGARPLAGERTAEALIRLLPIKARFHLLTCRGIMGETIARRLGFSPHLIGRKTPVVTSALETRAAAEAMLRQNVDLLLFAGGDGTARDIFTAVSASLPVVGIPAGVKIHSAVFALSPSRAGELAARFIKGEITRTVEAEVMDIDEALFRRQQVEVRLFGYLRIPEATRYIQSRKHGSLPNERYAQEAIAAAAADSLLKDDRFVIIGPGTTTRALMQRLELENTLLGVDLIRRRRLIAADVNERRLLELLGGDSFRLVLSPVGGQGYILGRGNQQISPEVIKRLERRDIRLLATPQKIHSLGGRPFLVDTGDRETDSRLHGYYRVTTGFRESVIYRVSS